MELFERRSKTVPVLLVGLDGSGKTTLIHHLKTLEASSTVDIVPTAGFATHTFSSQGMTLRVYDVSGQPRSRDMWRYFVKEVQGIIFVVDSEDKTRIAVARDYLESMLKHPEIQLRSIPILLLANKQDKHDVLSREDICRLLELDRIKDEFGKPWSIKRANGLTGEGIDEGMQFLAKYLK
eukprot:GILK01012554.1.p1 GENE.GILK01012554.1~~GILK01012554.1.p1  ORF type:complete len:191 (-),score=30.70 GILK01012554.1:300-839(-)